MQLSKMALTKPRYTKAEILEMSGVNSTTFNNWKLRSRVPFKLLGIERDSLTSHKYSVLVAAYCRALGWHKGQVRDTFIDCLTRDFKEIITSGVINEYQIIVVGNLGKGKDCGSFSNGGYAMQIKDKYAAHLPIGRIIKHTLELAQQDFNYE